jgi:hypothetical protein
VDGCWTGSVGYLRAMNIAWAIEGAFRGYDSAPFHIVLSGRDRSGGRWLLRCLAAALLVCACGIAHAQLVYLPASEWGKPFPNVPLGTCHFSSA